jgi:hypothetical protein
VSPPRRTFRAHGATLVRFTRDWVSPRLARSVITRFGEILRCPVRYDLFRLVFPFALRR